MDSVAVSFYLFLCKEDKKFGQKYGISFNFLYLPALLPMGVRLGQAQAGKSRLGYRIACEKLKTWNTRIC